MEHVKARIICTQKAAPRVVGWKIQYTYKWFEELVEAAAILWAIQVAKVDCWRDIIIESDSKSCVDALLQNTPINDWKIAVLCENFLTLAAEFSLCCFN